jgi:hypothetical protein
MALLVSWSEKDSVFGQDYEVTAISGCAPDGSQWKHSHDEAIAGIEAGDKDYYVDLNGLTSEVVVGIKEGTKYLKTKLDKDMPIILLALPDC